MQVVSCAIGKELVHFQALEADVVPGKTGKFITCFNDELSIDPVLKSAVAHLWFVTMHPFDDGNGRIARALAEMLLASSDNSIIACLPE